MGFSRERAVARYFNTPSQQALGINDQESLFDVEQNDSVVGPSWQCWQFEVWWLLDEFYFYRFTHAHENDGSIQ